MPWKVNLPLGVWPRISGAEAGENAGRVLLPGPGPDPEEMLHVYIAVITSPRHPVFNTSLPYTVSRNQFFNKNYDLKFVAQSNWNCFWSISVKEVEGPKDILSLHIFFSLLHSKFWYAAELFLTFRLAELWVCPIPLKVFIFLQHSTYPRDSKASLTWWEIMLSGW